VNSYRVALTASAEKELHALPAKVIARIMLRRPGLQETQGRDSEWRIRVRDYRIVYEIDDRAKTVDVTRIAHRREACD
jgi:mRNA interferase RelE/StbE